MARKDQTVQEDALSDCGRSIRDEQMLVNLDVTAEDMAMNDWILNGQLNFEQAISDLGRLESQ